MQLFKSNYPITSKAIIQKQLSDNVKSNYSKDWWRSKVIIQILFMKRLLSKLFSNLHAAIALSTHAQNVWKRKSAPQARKNWIQELKQAFLVHKNMVNRPKSSKIAPKARNFLGFWTPPWFFPPLVGGDSLTRGGETMGRPKAEFFLRISYQNWLDNVTKTLWKHDFWRENRIF